MLKFVADVCFEVPDGTTPDELAAILDYIKRAVHAHRYSVGYASGAWKMDNIDVPSFRPIKEINTEGTVVEISVTAAADGPAPSVAPTFSIGNDPKVPSVVVGDSSSQPPQWLIVAAHLSTEGVAYFWGPEFSGYTANLDKAGRYTEQEAKNREVWSERMEVAVTLAEAEAARFPAVRDDDAHVWFLRRFPGRKPGALG